MTSETSGAGPELSPEERELQALAIQERFAAEYRAGLQPRLADYLLAYPEHIGPLTDFVARLLNEGPGAEVSSDRAPLSAGTRRALETLFGASVPGSDGQAVAETRANYAAGALNGAPDDEPADE